MPKIFGSSLLALLLASVAFYMVGFLIYGILFGEQWLALVEMSEEDALARNEELGAMMFLWGYLITLAQVLGLAWVMDRAGASDIGSAIKVGVTLATLFALPIFTYNWLYEGRAFGAIGMDYAHLLIGYLLACIVLGLFRSKD